MTAVISGEGQVQVKGYNSTLRRKLASIRFCCVEYDAFQSIILQYFFIFLFNIIFRLVKILLEPQALRSLKMS